MADIFILGGGFGGIRTALDLSRKLGRHNVTLIDKNDCHLFLPSLYEVASARAVKQESDNYEIKLRSTVCVLYDRIFSGTNVNFAQAEVSHLNIKGKEIHLNSGRVLNYDYLVLSLGSEVADFGIPGVGEYAYQFKSVNDGLMIHQKMHELYENAKNGRGSLPIKFLIGGAGFTGIELAAELSCCTEHIRKLCNFEKGCTDITIFEAAPKILPMISDKEREIILRRLEKLGVKIFTDSPIESVESNKVKIKGKGFFEGDIVVWTAGIKASSFVSNIVGLHSNERGKIRSNKFLQAVDYENIYAIGDNAEIIDPKNEKPVPALAYAAIEQGKVVAENITWQINGKADKLKPYVPNYEYWIAPVGGKYAVAHLSNWITVTGLFGWLIRELVDLRYFIKTLPFFKAIRLFLKEMRVFTKND